VGIHKNIFIVFLIVMKLDFLLIFINILYMGFQLFIFDDYFNEG